MQFLPTPRPVSPPTHPCVHARAIINTQLDVPATELCPEAPDLVREYVDAPTPDAGFAGKPLSSTTLKATAAEADCAAACTKSSEAAYAKAKLGCTAYTFAFKKNRPTCILFEKPTMQCDSVTASAKDPGCSSALQAIASKVMTWVP